MVELGLEKAVGLLERLDLSSLGFDEKCLTGDDLFKCFDAESKANSAPITRFVVFYFRKFSTLIPRSHFCAAQVDSVE